ncbi:uncharacterized protein MAM_04080 [Metarhizium album ARSEF 1941]|uniref:DUF2293 domain-containing protein n=1 Tax=Metarhizium album (strain ARSEF 1941) TaxID=1081103 RepID=A0A0B2WXM1_METAS|nr:uncharacterized protein MAM_04080 [Metarhizium album ARSEF 1941]KHN98319.1 hypothetical protein MAM_04080 [Metarhizium album ARSEF 1941]
MGREKRKVKPPIGVSGLKEKRRRNQRFLFDPLAPALRDLAAKPTLPKSRHHTYFEFVENTDKKDKPLQLKETEDKIPPPGFEFVPIGNPWLTRACKDLSREKDAMIFVVSPVTTNNSLSQQVNRLGHHIRQTIVEEAKATIADLPESGAATPDGNPEPIPETQAEYHAQADAALRDLFPRIPNTDRQIIIEHAFTRVSISIIRPLLYSLTNRKSSQRSNTKGESSVGFSDNIPLARRVQLAVLAHIRHTHTRYDELLKQAGWQAARKAVETLCLDILVKWRGDEETGRDQLDEILREVVVISDSEDDSSDEETMDDASTDGDGSSSSVMISTTPPAVLPRMAAVEQPGSPGPTALAEGHSAHTEELATARSMDYVRKTDRKNQRGFKRYRAWQEAIMRSREADDDRSGLIVGGVGEYNPRHPQIPTRQLDAHRSTTYNGGHVERAAHCFAVGSGLPLMDFQSYTRPVTSPTYANQSTGIQASRDALNSSVYELPAESASSIRMMSPITRRLRDMAVPSIEPVSSETVMQPAFVRAVPPRQQDRLDPLPARPPSLFHTARSMSPMDGGVRDSPDRGGRRVISGYSADRRLQPSNSVLDAPIYVPRERVDYPLISDASGHARPASQGWIRPYEHPMRADAPRGDRIIVNASRPGTRTNPVLMEDRGGFFERVALPPEPRALRHQNEDSIAFLSEPYRATGSYRVVSSERSTEIPQDNRGNADIEVIPIPRPGALPNSRHSERFYGYQAQSYQSSMPEQSDSQDVESGDGPGHGVAGRHWPAPEVRRYPQVDGPSQIRQPSYRAQHGKRLAADDHYNNASRGRRRVRQSDDVIVLE